MWLVFLTPTKLSKIVNTSLYCHSLARVALRVFAGLLGMTLLVSTASAKKKFDESKLEFIDNGTIKLGVSLDLGGAITYLSKSGHDQNVINNHDWGRQIQMSFFGGPVPYEEKGQKPKKHWAHIGWNPIQAGDDYGNGSQIVEFTKKETSLYVKCIPKQWPLNNIPGECTYESFVELKGNTVEVRCRLVNARSNKIQYPGRHQELPAVYTNGEYYRLMTYRGDQPFTGDKLARIPKKVGGGFPWKYWLATENWAALVNDDDWGLGIYKPNNSLFIGGFAGKEGRGGTHDNATGYIAPLHTEILDHNITYEYDYSLILGSLDEIRGYALEQAKGTTPPDWKFVSDRQHWRYQANGGKGADAGWPIKGHLQLDLGKPGIAAISPPVLWHAKEAPVLFIEAAFKTERKEGMVAWTNYEADGHNPAFKGENQLRFDIIGDGKLRTYQIDLKSAPTYLGALSYLMVKPVIEPDQGAWVKIKGIRLGK